MKAAILTLSDKGARGERTDASGPALVEWLAEHGVETVRSSLIADEADRISSILSEWADNSVADLILTTGGTGVSPRDVTPDATRRILEREIPGFGEVMRAESLKKTPHAIISRAVAGIRRNSLIINLPGSPRGALENLAAVWSAVPHTVAKLQGDPGDCAQTVPAKPFRPVAVSFVAKSGTGKTTLIEQVITILKSRGWKVGAIKHNAHHFDIDQPGKDSYRMSAAGADTMLICTSEKFAMVKKQKTEMPLEELINRYFDDMDIVLSEGFKLGNLPKIEVHRAECGNRLICRDNQYDRTLIAVASDVDLKLDVPCLNLDNPMEIASFIEKLAR